MPKVHTTRKTPSSPYLDAFNDLKDDLAGRSLTTAAVLECEKKLSPQTRIAALHNLCRLSATDSSVVVRAQTNENFPLYPSFSTHDVLHAWAHHGRSVWKLRSRIDEARLPRSDKYCLVDYRSTWSSVFGPDAEDLVLEALSKTFTDIEGLQVKHCMTLRAETVKGRRWYIHRFVLWNTYEEALSELRRCIQSGDQKNMALVGPKGVVNWEAAMEKRRRYPVQFSCTRFTPLRDSSPDEPAPAKMGQQASFEDPPLKRRKKSSKKSKLMVGK